MSGHDDLTGAMNRGELNSQIEESIKSARANRSSLALLYVDIDNMKRFNNHNGHLVGDELLKRFVKLIEPMLKDQHTLYRVGGNEFALLLPNTAREEAVKIAQQICDVSREKLSPPQPANCGDPHCVGPTKISVSIGGSLFEPHMNAKSFLQDAEVKTYNAKSAGRDRVSM